MAACLTGMCGSAKSLAKNLGLLSMKYLAADRPDSMEREYSFCRGKEGERESDEYISLLEIVDLFQTACSILLNLKKKQSSQNDLSQQETAVRG